MYKTCSKCQISKPLSQFNLRNKSKQTYNPWCKQCIKIYDQDRYQNDIVYRNEINRKNRKDNRKWLDELKSTLRCSYCPENHPACLHFHHTNPEEKDDTIANALRLGWGKTRIMAEISKCIVLCANCHLKLHYNQKIGQG